MKTEQLLAEGKTKRVWESAGSGGARRMAIIESKNDLTAGDGAKHDIIEGKAALANQTTCNVFRLLHACGLPLAFSKQIDDTSFYAEQCDMIPLEMVVRREAHGSFLKRHPYIQKGHVFPKLLLEFFLKTSGKKWKGVDIPCDDPLMGENGELYLPNRPIYQQEPFLKININDLGLGSHYPHQLGNIALKTFLVLEKAWQNLDRKLVDFKVELGLSGERLLLADVIDNDSWRVVENGQYIDKQAYRDGADLDSVTEKYRRVTELTGRFHIPRQRVILWRGSENDNLDSFKGTLKEYNVPGACEVAMIACSVHKEPIRACAEITRLAQETPDAVLIAYVGRSNGAGPVLSVQVSVPVITVPATIKEFPEDAWSSLRMPSNVPVMTVLDPKNAMLAALQILAMRNPWLYAELRMRQEERLCNMVKL